MQALAAKANSKPFQSFDNTGAFRKVAIHVDIPKKDDVAVITANPIFVAVPGSATQRNLTASLSKTANNPVAAKPTRPSASHSVV